MALHAYPELNEPCVVSGVYFSALGREDLHRLMAGPHPFRLYTGYAGWGKRQLDQELHGGGWLTLPATADDVFYDLQQVDLWDQCRCRVGRDILSETLDLSHAPQDPEMN